MQRKSRIIDFDTDSDDEDGEQATETQYPVSFVMDERSNIYYVTEYDGQCLIKRCSPSSDKPSEHQTVFEITTKYCLGFKYNPKE